ncbi:MAG: hypothetical protein ACRCWR_09645 [Saezia sp.]
MELTPKIIDELGLSYHAKYLKRYLGQMINVYDDRGITLIWDYRSYVDYPDFSFKIFLNGNMYYGVASTLNYEYPIKVITLSLYDKDISPSNKTNIWGRRELETLIREDIFSQANKEFRFKFVVNNYIK